MSLDFRAQLQRYVGLDEREIAGVVSRFASAARTLVDVGANDGYYTVGFLSSSAERVIACEPGPACDRLLANAAANGHAPSSRFQLERRLVGSGDGEIALRELVADSSRPIFFKIDVDGAEWSVLESIEGYSFLAETLWIVETHSPELENKCLGWFARQNFQTRIIPPAFWRAAIPEQRPLAHNRWLVATSPGFKIK